MSRCFPYPPPGYSRNGATYEALIESIKLQKENDKSKAERKENDKSKAERKKEKKLKKEKKEHKQKRKEEEKSKSKLQKITNEHQQDANKAIKISSSADLKSEAINKKSEAKIEHLERSDLTEEHGQPISSSQKPSYSSDNSTQNSNKRKRDYTVLADDSSAHGNKPFKIRLLKKQKEADTSKETLCSNSGRTDQPSVSGADSRLNTWKIATDPLVTVNRSSGIPATSGRENITTFYSQTKSTAVPQKPPTKQTVSRSKHVIPSTSQSKTEEHVLLRSEKSDRQQPTSSVSRKIDVQGVRSGASQPTPSYGAPVLPPVQTKKDEIPKSTATRKRSIDEISQITAPFNKNGPTKVEEKKKEKKKSLSKSEKKIMKKHLKYEKLISSWVPSVLPAQLLDNGGDDDDWLSRSSKVARSASIKDDVVMSGDMAVSSLWQPCARYLVEADIHALPYTVPY